MARRQRNAAMSPGIGCRCLGRGEAEVERRARDDLPPRRLDDIVAPRVRSSAARPRRAGAAAPTRRSRAEAACRARRAPAGAVRRRPAASAVATSACSGVPSPIFWASAIRSTIRALESSGSRCRVALSISASRSGSRRSTSPAMAMAKPWSAGARPRDPCAAESSVRPRRSTASSICSAARRAATPSVLGIGASQCSSCRNETAQPISIRPRPCPSRRRVPEPGAAGRRRAARWRGAKARPHPLRRLGEEGHRDRFLNAFGPRRPRQHAARAPRRRRRPSSRRSTASTIGMSMPRSARQPRQHRRGERAFGDRAAVGHQLGRRAALAEAHAEREIARAGRRAGQHQVAEAGQAGERFPPRAEGDAEAGHFGKAAADQRGARILAEAAPSTTPQAIASTFLTAPPISAPATSSVR